MKTLAAVVVVGPAATFVLAFDTRQQKLFYERLACAERL